MAEVSIVVPTYKDSQLVDACVTSLMQNTVLRPRLSFELTVVDDGSPDEVAEALQELSRKHGFELILRQQNGGFAKAVNDGIRRAGGSWIVLANNDIEFPYSDWLENLIVCAESSGDIGIVGSILLYPGNNLIQHVGQFFHREGPAFDHLFRYFPLSFPPAQVTTDRVAVTGALMLIKKQVVDDIGLFDEAFFASHEDADYCLRARERGWRVLVCGQAIAVHHEGMTRGDYIETVKDDCVESERRDAKRFWAKWQEKIDTPVFDNGPPRKRILVAGLANDYDCLLATPALRALSKAYPDHHMTVATPSASVFVGNGSVHETRTDEMVFAEPFALRFELDRAAAPARHPMETFARQCGVRPEIGRSEVFCGETEEALSRQIVPERSFAVVHTGPVCNALGWPLERFKRVCDELAAAGLEVVRVGRQSGPSLPIGLDLRDRLTIPQLAAVIARAELFMGVEDTPAHIAQAVGTSTVVLFGAIRPELRTEEGADVHPVHAADLGCLWCYERAEAGTAEPICAREMPDCMRLIAAEDVVNACLDVLKTTEVSAESSHSGTRHPRRSL